MIAHYRCRYGADNRQHARLDAGLAQSAWRGVGSPVLVAVSVAGGLAAIRPGHILHGCNKNPHLATAVSVTLLPIGLVCLLAGVVLPRIEGVFTTGPRGVRSPPT
jgi:hypothetical protein